MSHQYEDVDYFHENDVMNKMYLLVDLRVQLYAVTPIYMRYTCIYEYFNWVELEFVSRLDLEFLFFIAKCEYSENEVQVYFK